MSESIINWEQYKLAVEQTYSNMGLLGQFVHGDENTLVLLGGKNTPSVRKMVSEIKTAQNSIISNGVTQIQSILSSGTAQIQAISTQAAAARDAAAQSAANASQSAAEAAADAESLASGLGSLESTFALLEPGIYYDCLCSVNRLNAAMRNFLTIGKTIQEAA